MVWAGLSLLVSFVNSIVWNGNTVNWVPVLCDICEVANFFEEMTADPRGPFGKP